MNRTVAIFTFVCLTALGVVGYVVLSIVKPDSAEQFVSFILLILSNVTVAWGVLWNLGRTNEKLETVRKQTNGALSNSMERNDRQAREIRDREIEIRVLQDLLDRNGHTTNE